MLLIIINSTRATKNSYKNLDENHSQYRYFNFKIWRNKEIFLIVATQGFGSGVSGFQISPDSGFSPRILEQKKEFRIIYLEEN